MKEYIKTFETESAMTEYLEGADIDVFVGYTKDTEKVHWSDALPNYAEQYLTFVAEENNMSVGLSDANNNVFQYSVDNGSTWNNLANDQSTSSVNTGEKILFKASGLTTNYENGIGTLKPSVNARVQGNIMSLVYGDNFAGKTSLTIDYQFGMLFHEAIKLTSVEHLILPATTMTRECYYAMFQGCTSLTVTPKLPATTLAYACYGTMFADCTSLTTATALPATTLAEGCYSNMFAGCTSLNSITCLATDISADYCTYNWVSRVAASGTFIKHPSMTGWTTGIHGIPNGWTVVNA